MRVCFCFCFFLNKIVRKRVRSFERSKDNNKLAQRQGDSGKVRMLPRWVLVTHVFLPWLLEQGCGTS